MSSYKTHCFSITAGGGPPSSGPLTPLTEKVQLFLGENNASIGGVPDTGDFTW